MTSSGSEATRPTPASSATAWSPAATVAWSWAAPLAAALATVRYLIPSRMDGGARGFFALAARLRDQHPLAVGVVLFVLFAETAKYWRRQYAPAARCVVEIPARDAAQAALASRRSTRRFAAMLAAVAALALAARASVVEIYRVLSPSMSPTLNVGDRVLVNRLAYGLKLPLSRHAFRARAPRRGDLVVFPNPDRADDHAAPAGAANEPGSLIKRVLGLPGDVVSFSQGRAIVNGWPVPACDAGPFAATAGTVTVRGRLVVEFLDDRAYLTVRLPIDDTSFAAYEVPPGEVFVVGDDRVQSRDSRAWNRGRGGSLPIDRISGRVSRLAVGGFRDGRLDLARVLTPLRLEIREPTVDLRQTEDAIAACLQHRPRSTTPPAPRRSDTTALVSVCSQRGYVSSRCRWSTIAS